MQMPPLSVIEAWPEPNYVDPETRGHGNLILNIVLFSLVIVFISLRIFTRTYLKKIFGADDMFILMAMVPATAFFLLSVLAHTRFLWVRHQYDIPADNVTTGLKMVLSAQIMFAAACTLTKLSMLMFVRRMLTNSSLFWRRITVFSIAIVTLQGSVFVITVIFQCRPPQDYWKISFEPQSNCISQGGSLLAAGIVNTLTDFIVVLLPIRTVWSLELPRRQLVVVILLFACGFISCTAGAVRTYYTYVVSQVYDQVWAAYPVWVTAAIELDVGLICASLPATKMFFSMYIPQVFGTMRSRVTSDNSSQPEVARVMVQSYKKEAENELQDMSERDRKSAGSPFTERDFADRHRSVNSSYMERSIMERGDGVHSAATDRTESALGLIPERKSIQSQVTEREESLGDYVTDRGSSLENPRALPMSEKPATIRMDSDTLGPAQVGEEEEKEIDEGVASVVELRRQRYSLVRDTRA